MIKTYKLEQGKILETAEPSAPILLIVDPTAEERAQLITQYQIDEHNLASALDPNELPRVEMDANHLVTIFKHPKNYSVNDNFVFRTNSVALFLFKERLIIVAPEEFPAFEGRSFARVTSLQTLFLRILSLCVSHFVSHLQIINDIANELEAKLVTAMENRNLLLMFSIEKSLVYYINAISANGRVIERLKANAKNAETVGLSPEMLEYVDDLAIENAQCQEQAQVYANVFTGLMDARATIVSNNQNVLIKRLTVINVVFLPLNVLASLGGMSEYSTVTQGVPWEVSYGLFTLALVIIGVATFYVLRMLERRSLRG